MIMKMTTEPVYLSDDGHNNDRDGDDDAMVMTVIVITAMLMTAM